MSELTTFLLITAIFCIVFPLFWFSIILLNSYVSGWRTLAESYAALNRLSEGVLTWKSGFFRSFARYNSTLHIKATESGLYLATGRFFRLGHSPLLIPWDRVLQANRRKVVGTFIELNIATSQYSDTDTIKLSLFGRGVADHLMPSLEKHGLISAESNA